MKLKQIGSNQTLLILDNGNEVFFSYETPVAARVNDDYYRTEKNWSVTTSKHINKYLAGVAHRAKSVPQVQIEMWAVQS